MNYKCNNKEHFHYYKVVIHSGIHISPKKRIILKKKTCRNLAFSIFRKVTKQYVGKHNFDRLQQLNLCL